MDTVVIPYFLALVNASYELDHGPLYTYAVDVNFTRSPERDLPADYSLILTSTLRCRPMNATVLSCILDNRRMAMFDYKRDARFERIQTGKEFFEINFERSGVESLRVSSASTPATSDKRYGLIKTIASLLNIGTDLGERTSLVFTDKEISTFGECRTLFDVSKSSCESNVTTRKHLNMRSILYESFGDSIVLHKKRDVRKCDGPAHVLLIENDAAVVRTVTSSLSEICLCRDSFESTTTVEGKAMTVNEDAQASVFRQIAKLRFEKVERAEEDLPSFNADPAIDTIYLHRDVDNNELDT